MLFCAVFILISVRAVFAPPSRLRLPPDARPTEYDCILEKYPPVFSQLVALFLSRSIRTNVGIFF